VERTLWITFERQVKELGWDHLAAVITCRYTNKEMVGEAQESGMEVVTCEVERAPNHPVLEGCPSQVKNLTIACQNQTSRYYTFMKQFVETCELAAEKDIFRWAPVVWHQAFKLWKLTWIIKGLTCQIDLYWSIISPGFIKLLISDDGGSWQHVAWVKEWFLWKERRNVS